MLEPETLAALNARVVELARSWPVTRGRKLRVGSLGVETPSPHPTDRRLGGDGVRGLSRWLRRATRALASGARRPQRRLRRHTRSVRRLGQQIPRRARRTGAAARAQRRETSARRLAVAHHRSRQAEPRQALRPRRRRRLARRIAAHLAQSLPLVRQAIRHAPPRALEGTRVPAAEQLVSLVEPHPQVLQRQKPGQPVECGRKVWLPEAEGGLSSQSRGLRAPGPGHPHVLPSLDAHLTRFSDPPWLVAGDRGVYTSANERLAEQAGVTRVVIP